MMAPLIEFHVELDVAQIEDAPEKGSSISYHMIHMSFSDFELT